MSQALRKPVAVESVALKIELPDAERGLGVHHVARFDKIKRRLLRSDLKPAQREAAIAELYALEHGPRQVARQAATDAAIAESVALHEARGEEVRSAPNSVRITTHDGLHSLYVLHRITQEQYDEGILFRRAWNKRSGDLTPPPPGEGSHSAHQHEAFMAAKSLRAFDLQRLGKITIHVALYGSPNALTMLNRVAGDGTALRVFGGGRAFERNLTDLQKALDLCAKIPAKDRDRRG